MENVLVVKTQLLAPYISGRTGLITGCEAEVMDIIQKNFTFLPRPQAEDDPGHKQIIPYVAIVRGDEVFVLRRLKKGGEARLHGLLSIGVGGHINPDDGEQAGMLMRGLRREIDEEVALTDPGTLTLRGLINDDTNSVGSVHLGYFFTLETAGDVSVRETEKLEGSWEKLSALPALAERMETWSQIAAGSLAE